MMLVITHLDGEQLSKWSYHEICPLLSNSISEWNHEAQFWRYLLMVRCSILSVSTYLWHISD